MSAGANVYEVTIKKSLNSEEWANVYYVRANNLAEAGDHAVDIIETIERPRHMDFVTFESYRVRPVGTSDQGTTIPIGLNGLTAGGAFLPLFAVLRVDLATSLGRPSRKFYRLPINESWQNNGQLVEEFFLQMNVFFAGAINPTATPWLCDVDGQEIIAARPYRNVGMRQLKRGSKRKPVTP